MGSEISALSEPFERKGRLHQHRGCSPVGFPESDSDTENQETKEENKPIREKPKASPKALAARKPPVIKPPTASSTPVAKQVGKDKVPPHAKKQPPVRKSPRTPPVTKLPPGTSESKKPDAKPVTPRTASARSRKPSLRAEETNSSRKPPTSSQQSAIPKVIPNDRQSSHRKKRRRSVRERNKARPSISNLNDSDSDVSHDNSQSSSDDENVQKRDRENSFPPLPSSSQGRKVSLVGRQLSSEEARVSNHVRGAEGGCGARDRLAEPEAVMFPPAPSVTSMVSGGSVTGQKVRRSRHKARPDTRGSNDAALVAPPSMTYNASSLRDILMTVLSPGDEDPHLTEVRKKEDPDGWLDDKRGRLAKYLSLEMYHESPESHAHYIPLPDSFPFREMDTQSRESLLAIVPTLDVSFLTSLENGSLDDEELIELISNMNTRVPTSEPSKQYPRHVYRLSYMKDALAKARRITNWDEVKKDSMTRIKLVKIMVKVPKADRLPPISQKDYDDMRS